MTSTDDILALAARAVPTEQADADLALFDEAVLRGMTSDVMRCLRALRPDRGTPAALPDSPAWRAWLSATAAIAGTMDATPDAATRQANPGAGTRQANPGAGPRETDPTACFIVCAAVTALGHDCSAAVAAGTQAVALVESGLAAAVGWSVPVVSAVVGAGLAAGLMLRLPRTQLRHALGICATQAAGIALNAATGTDAGPLQAGKAAFNAVEAAHLARLGCTSSRDPLGGRRGLFALFSG